MVFEFIPTVPDIDLSEKRVLVTGGNVGIGLEVARKFYLLGANVTIASRNEAKSLEAIEDIKKGTAIYPGGSIDFLSLDLGDQESVKEFAAKYSTKPLNILVNNSGFMDMHCKRDEEGLLKTIRVNHFGPFLLTNLLTESLRQGFTESGTKSRAVFLSSGAHMIPGIIVKINNLSE
jgi:NAD(P)-dependent dehydrogenase (short-subunit alcohol dehydrogenase family)